MQKLFDGVDPEMKELAGRLEELSRWNSRSLVNDLIEMAEEDELEQN